jgi:hypothetical protein
VTVNDTLLHYAQDDLPFGGVGASGMGAYHGEEGFLALSHAKGVFVQSGWSSAGVLRAPFAGSPTSRSISCCAEPRAIQSPIVPYRRRS